MRRFLFDFVVAGIAVLGNADATAEEPRDTIKPRLQDCRLTFDGKDLAPRGIFAQARQEQVIGKHVLGIGAGEIQEFKEGQKDASWTAKIPDGQKSWLVEGEGDRAFVLTYEEEDGRFMRYDPEVRIRVLDLAKGTWLADVRPAPVDKETLNPVRITAIKSRDGLLAVISLWGEPGKDREKSAVSHYQVDCFTLDQPKLLWSRRFEMPDRRGYDGVFVWGIPGPRYAESALQPLSWLDDGLLVCAEARQPMMFLSRYSGRSLWQRDHLWELERGFIGPSVYSFYIGPFGQEAVSSESLPKLRENFEENWTASIVGGPVVVPLPFERNGDAYSIFVAVLKGPKKTYASYLTDCVIYEFNEDGSPVSMGKVPQLLEGGEFAVTPGGVVWRGQNDSLVRVAAAKRAPEISMGGGGPDCTLRLDWFRQLESDPHEAWFSSPPSGDPVAFSDQHAFSIVEGGFILDEGSSVYSFPILATRLRDGVSIPLVLNVPFDGKFTLPETNYSSVGGKMRSRLPYLLAVTQLEARGSVLRVTLGREHAADVLEFDLGASPILAVAGSTPSEDIRREAAVRRVKALKDVNERDKETGSTPLFGAIHDKDTSYLQALLDAGADPKIKSRYGWTALMDAGCYGTAEAVELLIRAGSDLNAKDGNCGGQTVLIWSSRSENQPARKVRALLDAGADANLGSDKGWTPLMSAAQEGKITCVELLLARGASASAKTSEGKSVLDYAHEGRNEEVVHLIEEALGKK